MKGPIVVIRGQASPEGSNAGFTCSVDAGGPQMVSFRSVKQPILVVYDYGSGGVWAFVVAESAEEVEREFPELKVTWSRPSWMSAEEEERIAREATYDLHADRSFGLLAEIIDSRGQA